MEQKVIKDTTNLQNQKTGGFFNRVERIGNKIPHPFILFIYMIAFLFVVTALLSVFHV